MSNYTTQSIAEYISQKILEDFPLEIIEKAKYCILDSIGCMLAGIKTKEGKILTKSLLNTETGSSSIFGLKSKTNLINAVYINSMSVNVLDFDDNYIGHPGATIIPLALNMGQLLGISGKELLTAIIIAYEISIRIGRLLRSEEERKYILGHGTWQVFGSVSVASKLLQLKKMDIQNAFGIAGASAPVPSVMKTTYGLEGPSMAKNNFGTAAITGLQSGLLAKNGFTGPIDIFEGETAFWRMIGKKHNGINNCLFRVKEKDFMISRISFKFYPCCRLTHSSIDAVIELIKKNNVKLNDIKKIIVKSIKPLSKFPFTTKNPKDAAEGRFSIPFIFASVLYDIDPLQWYNSENINSIKLQKFAEKIEIENDQQANSIFREDPNKILSKIIILDKNMTKYDYEKLVPRGINLAVNEKKDLKEKFFNSATPIYTNPKKIESLIKSIMELDKREDIKEFMKEFTLL